MNSRDPDAARTGRARPNRLTPILLLAAALVVISLLTRIVLLGRTDTVLPAGPGPLAVIFGSGLYFDLVAATYFVTPLLVWLALMPNRLAATRTHQLLVLLAFAVQVYLLTLVAVAEWLFWEEFGARFNFIAVDYLLYTQEVIGNIRQSYPVGPILGALALPALTLTALLGRRLRRAAGAPLSWRATIAALAVQALLVASALRFVDSDQKDFSASDSANELAGNGIYEFFAANFRNELNFEKFYVTLRADEALAQAKREVDAAGEWLTEPADGFERRVAGWPPLRLNVILVSIESMGAEFLDAYGNGSGLTPNLDRLTRASLWFSNAYATGNRTVRGLEALALALPPTPGQSIVRRPRNERLFSLGSVFEDLGYETFFAYGGYGYFDNMNAFFDRNDYNAIDRTDIPRQRITFENAWGVADEILFDFVLDELDRRQQTAGAKPFFAHIMTTSNHRPYTYPAGRIDIPSGTGREGAVKYADWAIGHLLEQARKRPWFDDTLFVITADHGANARGTIEIPIDKYRIPVFFYAPKHVPPRRVERLMSQIDIAPTLLGLLGASYYSKFFGRDLMHAQAEGDRAFVANYQTLGFMRDGKVVVLQPQRKVSVFKLDAQGKRGATDGQRTCRSRPSCPAAWSCFPPVTWCLPMPGRGGQGSVREPVAAHWRVVSGGKARRSAATPWRRPERGDQCSVHGDLGHQRDGQGADLPDRPVDRAGRDRRGACDQGPAVGVRTGHAPVRPAHHASDAVAGAFRPAGEYAVPPAAAGIVPVRDRSCGGAHAGTAAHGDVGHIVAGRVTHGQARCHRQAPSRDPQPGQHGRAVHGQDGDAHRGPHSPGVPCRRARS